jgi:hypothetical protein
MSKTEVIQRCKVKLTEVKQSATRKIEDEINAALSWLGDEEIRIAKEGLTNGSVTKVLVETALDQPKASDVISEVSKSEVGLKGKPDRE